jgi:hypothetical protein
MKLIKYIETKHYHEGWYIIQNKHTMISLDGKCIFDSLPEILHAAGGKVKKNPVWAPRTYNTIAEFKNPIELQVLFAEHMI